MTIRTELLLNLRQEVLGPRTSFNEVLPKREEPRNEFITGILIPKIASVEDAQDIEGEVETLGTGIDESGEDDLDDEGIIVAASPVLDPKSLPRSLGISFIVSAEGDFEPQILICATWARYLDRQDPQGNQVFQRTPNCYVTSEPISVVNNPIFTEEDIKISLRSIKRYDNTYKVSIYLVNETEPTGEVDSEGRNRVHTRDIIFQPQIRIICGEDTNLLPFDSFNPDPNQVPDSGSLEEEDESLALIYKDYQAYARGHLCAAIWKEIDPERPTESDENPLLWIDGDIVESQYGKEIWKKFTLPDCRTEYVPCYSVQAPDINWKAEIDNKPNLDTNALAECWHPDAIREALQPLVDGYEDWIGKRGCEINSLDIRYQRAASRHLDLSRQTQERIQEAINLIAENEEVRLSFCFSNKAIDLQASWKKPGQSFKWRPFQLAFILLNIPAVADPLHSDRDLCDLLAFATGGGKTEAYLGLAAFTMGLRRLRSQKDTNGDRMGHGVSVISRYTLRLLTIQQFRRALGLIVACDVLRVKNFCQGSPVGWRPKNCQFKESNIWGTTKFSAGLWVGGGVTPNALKHFKYGAIKSLEGEKVEGEPAQVLNCPCCNSILAVPKDGLGSKQEGHTLHLIFKGNVLTTRTSGELNPLEEMISPPTFSISSDSLNDGYVTLSLKFRIKQGTNLSVKRLDNWWQKEQRNIDKNIIENSQLIPFIISRPGYFKKSYRGRRGAENIEDFNIYCPNPKCYLNIEKTWNAKVPIKFNQQANTSVPNSLVWEETLEAFQKTTSCSLRIPISAYTVDDQIYSRIPSLLVATVDKFARLAFEPRAGALFGNVNRYCSREGYYRAEAGVEPRSPQNQKKEVDFFQPPDLILQDELHLIEGPLGSMVGLYETAIDTLGQRTLDNKLVSPKYIASTATVRQSQSQIQCLFNRRVFQFPPLGLSASDNFFARTRQDVHPLEINENGQHPSGRLYVAVCAPGKGAQTPVVRLYSSMLQSIEELRQGNWNDEDCDPYWTLVGYFNAIRELAGALTLYRQDIPERLSFIAQSRNSIERDIEEAIELSSRRDSTELPGLLTSLSQELPEAKDIVLSTSMFATGVDIDRLALMIVNGQPKTTSSYIQATGRVGRRIGGLVITFFRASRPRDLDHYEFFTGYHRAIYRYVEPVTVTPFASRARERGVGPVTVALLRQAINIQDVSVGEWAAKENAASMENQRHSAPELQAINEVITNRSQAQIEIRRPPEEQVKREVEGGLDRWHLVAQTQENLVYEEYAIDKAPTKPVVLGDEQHQKRNCTVVYRNAPQSLRDVEGMTRFGSISSYQYNNQGEE